MPSRPTRPRPFRFAFVAAAAIVALHVFARDAIETTRLRVLDVLLAPTSVVRALGRNDEAPPVDVRLFVEERSRTRAGLFAELGLVALPVLDYRPREGLLIVAAGRDAGVTSGARVLAPEGLLGHVERVESHLSRVRLLSARGARTASVAAQSKSGLPGGIERLAAVVEGDGDQGLLVDGVLLEMFKEGDSLIAFGPGAVPIGRVVSTGVRPRVRFAAVAASAEAVAVEGVGRSASVVDVFEEERLRVVASPALGGRGAFLRGEAAARLQSGAGVHVGGFYLGRVERTAEAGAYVSRRDDPGHEIGVRLVGPDFESGHLVRAGRNGAFAIVGDLPDLPPGSAVPVRAFTAGGGWLVPPGLFFGRFLLKDGALFPSDQVVPWPSTVTATVFLFDAERAVLTRRAR